MGSRRAFARRGLRRRVSSLREATAGSRFTCGELLLGGPAVHSKSALRCWSGRRRRPKACRRAPCLGAILGGWSRRVRSGCGPSGSLSKVEPTRNCAWGPRAHTTRRRPTPLRPSGSLSKSEPTRSPAPGLYLLAVARVARRREHCYRPRLRPNRGTRSAGDHWRVRRKSESLGGWQSTGRSRSAGRSSLGTVTVGRRRASSARGRASPGARSGAGYMTAMRSGTRARGSSRSRQGMHHMSTASQ